MAREPRLGEPEHHRQGDQALLRTVVQIALDALALGVGGGDDALPGVAQVVDALAQGARTSRFCGFARETDRFHLIFSLVPESRRRLLTSTRGFSEDRRACAACKRGGAHDRPMSTNELKRGLCSGLDTKALHIAAPGCGRTVDRFPPTKAASSVTPEGPRPRPSLFERGPLTRVAPIARYLL